eukprot:jgi/Picre1/33706/NNA_001185.t1
MHVRKRTQHIMIAKVAVVLVAFLAAANAQLGTANFTLVSGAVSPGAGGSLVLTPPTNQDDVGEIIFYNLIVENLVDFTSSQILMDGEIVVAVAPTDTDVDNADYSGIITYGEDDENPSSDVETATVDGVEILQYKDGKTIADFESAMAAGELTAVVRTAAYPKGLLTGDLKATSASNPAAEAIISEKSSASKTVLSIGAAVAALFAF